MTVFIGLWWTLFVVQSIFCGNRTLNYNELMCIKLQAMLTCVFPVSYFLFFSCISRGMCGAGARAYTQRKGSSPPCHFPATALTPWPLFLLEHARFGKVSFSSINWKSVWFPFFDVQKGAICTQQHLSSFPTLQFPFLLPVLCVNLGPGNSNSITPLLSHLLFNLFKIMGFLENIITLFSNKNPQGHMHTNPKNSSMSWWYKPYFLNRGDWS